MEDSVCNAPEDAAQFRWPEYTVFSAVLLSSVGIGVFYGCFGRKQTTNEEYLLGSRKMNPIPVALSLLCRYVGGQVASTGCKSMYGALR